MSVHVSDLRPDHSLLDPNFDGYKLDLQQFHPIRKQLNSPVLEPTVSPDVKYSFNHSKYSMLFNSLMEDKFDVQNLYYFDTNCCLHQVNVVFGEVHNRIVCSLPSDKPRMFCSVSFPDREHAFVFNGVSTYFLCQTGIRRDSNPDTSGSKQWECLGSVELEGFPILQSSAAYEKVRTDCQDFVFCVTGFEVSDFGDNDQGSSSKTKCQRVRFSIDNNTLELLDCIEFLSASVPDLVSLNQNGLMVQLAGTSPFKPKTTNVSDASSAERLYRKIACFQNSTCLRIVISSVQASDDDLSVQFEPKLLKISRISDSKVVLSAVLECDIDPGKCSHSFESTKKNLNIFLEKTESVNWDKVFEDESLQEVVEIFDDDEELRKKVSEDEGMNKPYNVEELDEICDGISSTERSHWQMFQLDWATDHSKGVPLYLTSLHAHEILFSRILSATSSEPVLCLRHDVDALLWATTSSPCNQPQREQPNSSTTSYPWLHHGTINALGYVQASKRDKKFISCAPSCRYAAIAECSRRIFLYGQPEKIETTLVNRKTGKRYPKIAKQYVITLDNDESILGLACLDEYLLVLLKDELLVFHLLF